ncbi:pilus assembly protein [Niveibacterium sp.]|uniref:pilus assembly protein n=1 Tax=Niveibacterium sp. TaxID=2017444 RepID=UPI0035ADD26A
MKIKSNSKMRIAARAWLVWFSFGSIVAHADIGFATAPVLEAQDVPPNLVVTLDDSGSMKRGYLPDNSCTGTSGVRPASAPATKRMKSAYFNPLQYDPTRVYRAPINDTGVAYTTSFTRAYYNGFDPTRGYLDLSTGYQWTLAYNPAAVGSTVTTTNSCGDDLTNGHAVGRDPDKTVYTASPAYYYVRDNSLYGCVATDDFDERCYRRVNVSATSGVGGSDERQNFANWYSFYRIRNLATASSASLAFKSLPDDVRIAWQGLTTCTSFGATACDGWSNTTGYDANLDNRIRGFSGPHKQRFYNWLSRLPASGNTPLRQALSKAGEYYRTSGADSPYAQNPHETTWGPELACRQNYTIVMTDGYWNGNDASPTAGNADGTTTNAPDGLSEHRFVAPMAPYTLSTSSTLADVAFKYWITDLRTDAPMINVVQPYMVEERDGDPTQIKAVDFWNAKNDPATWQHMVTFTVGLGMTTALKGLGLDYSTTTGTWGGSYPALAAGTMSWPVPSSDSINNTSDLWHAAINSRGQFFSAENPDDLIAAFNAIINRVSVGRGAAAAAATNSNQVAAESALYAGVYYGNTSNQLWAGEVKKIPLDDAGVPLGTTAWTTGGVTTDSGGARVWVPGTMASPDPNARTIITYHSSTRDGVPFRWSSIDSASQAALAGGLRTGSDVLNWVRGDATNEGEYDASTGRKGLRARPATKLGDIVNSSPVYVGKPDAGLTGETYFQFFRDHETRTPVVYVGSNDGMLHGFDDTGREVLAYIPSLSYTYLRETSQPAYEHRFLVDGTPSATDIEYGSTYRTVLIGGMRSGGKGYYALDVTDPAVFSEGRASDIVLWEFAERATAATSDDSSGYLGYSFSRPVITKLQNGKWAAIFGNGYNNTNDTPALYVLYINEGTSGWTLGTNFFRIPVTTAAVDGNGLSQPTVFDTNGDGLADTVWAGDLQGNLWKFDLSSATPSSWNVGYGGRPLYTAKTSGGTPQAITTSPRVVKHPNGGWFVAFATGRALTAADMADTTTQTVYGVWDINGPVADRSKLRQRLATTDTSSSPKLRTFADTTAPNWWSPSNTTGQYGYYFDLPDSGERVINEMQNRGGALAFVSIVPTGDPCAGGGYSWLNEFDLLTGTRLTQPPWDLNHDGRYDRDDMTRDPLVPTDRVPPTGRSLDLSGAGFTTLNLDRQSEVKMIITARGEVFNQLERVSDSTGRMSWREIMR